MPLLHQTALILALLLSTTSLSASRTLLGDKPDARKILQGRVSVLSKSVATSGQPEHSTSLQLVLESGKRWKLLLPDHADAHPSISLLLPGAQVTVVGTVTQLDSNPKAKALLVDEVQQLQNAQQLDTVSEVEAVDQAEAVPLVAKAAKPRTVPAASVPVRSISQDIGILAILLDFCGDGGGAATTLQEADSLFFGSATSSSQQTLTQYYDKCSNGQAVMDRTTSRVIGPITIPCTGTTSYGAPFSTTSCHDDDYYGWADSAMDQARQQMGQKELDRYRSIVLILPKNFAATAGADCGFVATAEVGPYKLKSDGSYGYSLVWVSGEKWDTLHTYMHEVNHNLYLGHAGQADCEYCDSTCVMGYCCATRCPNAPHMLKLGWAQPITTVDVSTLTPGATSSFELPSYTQSLHSVLVLDASKVGGRASLGSKYYVGFRQSGSVYDDVETASNMTHVYRMSDGGPVDTLLLGSLVTGQNWTESSTGLVVRQVGSSSSTSTVTVCRQSQTKELNCGDGLDDDCDGLIDFQDPDCQQVAASFGAPPVPKPLVRPPPGKKGSKQRASPPRPLVVRAGKGKAGKKGKKPSL